MAISIGINGFGRIGRVALRIAISRPETFKLCGINARMRILIIWSIWSATTLHLDVSRENLELMNTDLSLTGRRFLSSQKVMLLPIPWGSCGAEYIIDATGALQRQKGKCSPARWCKKSHYFCTCKRWRNTYIHHGNQPYRLFERYVRCVQCILHDQLSGTYL